MYAYVYIYIYIYIYIFMYTCTRGRDKNVVTQRSAAVPHVFSWEDVATLWQNAATSAHLKQDMGKMWGICGPSVETPFVLTPSGSQ